jgi:NAD(P)-dependent dehydrogenase (short-subunit alcohol dehydrogenase family)
MNAGIYPDSGRVGAIDRQAVSHCFQVNALGQLLLAEAVLPNLRDGGRLAFITSRMGSIADNTSGGSYAYRMSKAALNMAARSLAIDLAKRGIAVSVIHPGFVRTDMTHGQGLIDADVSARGIIARVAASSLDNSGSFWHQNGDPLPW